MSSEYKLSTGRLAQKVNWEGGVLEAVQYGIKSIDIADPVIARKWKRLEALWSKLEPELVDVSRLLRDATERAA